MIDAGPLLAWARIHPVGWFLCCVTAAIVLPVVTIGLALVIDNRVARWWRS